MQTTIPYHQFRGGSSKGLFFKFADLPADEALRDRVILAAMEGVGQGDLRQIDGLGGGTTLTSKVALVRRSTEKNVDLDYLFLQVVIGKGQISSTQTCGNILAGVLPFAIESGLLAASSPVTSATIRLLNTGALCEVMVQTPQGSVEYTGHTKIDGVPGTAAPIICHYLDTAGSTCGALFPTGHLIDLVDGIRVTCIDNGMPEVILQAADLDISGYESPTELDNNEVLKQKLESIRLQIGPQMNLGEVKDKTIPKMCLIAPPLWGGAIHTRTFLPHICHEAIGVLGAASTAIACVIPGTVAYEMAEFVPVTKDHYLLSVEHPSGEFTVNLTLESVENQLPIVKRSGVLRTARLLSRGEVFIPEGIWRR
jgi:4-oxalomesaconate tautomerase